VPTNAVIETSNKQYVAFVTGKTNNKKETVVTRKEVTIGTSTADKIEVLSGLTEGEKIVTEGVRSLKDNMTVRVVE
jgi:multidrug efflux pump subunit AcrA (membrane-fusion protein)